MNTFKSLQPTSGLQCLDLKLTVKKWRHPVRTVYQVVLHPEYIVNDPHFPSESEHEQCQK